MKHVTKTVLAVLMVAGSVSLAIAATANAPFVVSATVDSTATFTSSSASFGTLAGGAVNQVAQGGFDLTVNTAQQPSVTFTPASSTTAPFLAGPGTNIPYRLYLPTGATGGSYGAASAACPAAGAGTQMTYASPYTVSTAGATGPLSYNICALIPTVPNGQLAGAYSDNVALTLNY